MKKYILLEDKVGDLFEIGRCKTLKEAVLVAKAEAILRTNTIYIVYDKEDSSFEIGFDPEGRQI